MSDHPASPLERPDNAAPVAPVEEVLACSIHAAPPPMERRSFLVWIASGLLAIGGVLAGATVVEALVPPSRSIDGKTKVGRVAVAKLADLQVGKPVATDYGDDVLWVIKTSPTQVAVLNQACPHVGCKLSFNPNTKHFDCPCHASHFAMDGKRIDGPAPRNMDPAAFEIVNGEVIVSSAKA
ncbi:MAG: Rieske 2Fe-2S domain-containing protein [Coriobacteriia bacterium]|nr:Rieske 2Fe-2S domain-containing protein [Coriobacteriia bacterium]